MRHFNSWRIWKAWKVNAIPFGSGDYLDQRSVSPFFRDALAAPITKKMLTPGQLQYLIFSVMPVWVQALMALRNRIVRYLGFDVGRSFADDTPDITHPTDLKVGDSVAFMQIIHADAHEVVGFSEDKHMQFFLSVTKQENKVVVSTMVNLKTWTGRVYMAVVKPFHWVIARIVIHNAVKDGRI